MTNDEKWALVQQSPTYWPSALTDAEGRRIRWHSPADPRSSQVFCISAFGGLRHLPDGNAILDQLAGCVLPVPETPRNWIIRLEHVDRSLLGETGSGMPTNIDAFCESEDAVLCIESKFIVDAAAGFGGCGQVKPGRNEMPACAGYFGPGSDRKTGSPANCRLEVAERNRSPRSYWAKGAAYFEPSIFRQQSLGEACPFAGPNFQIMRNFLFAAAAADGDLRFAAIAVAPVLTGAVVRTQLDAFRKSVLRPECRSHVATADYDRLAELLVSSANETSRALGVFLTDRMAVLCRNEKTLPPSAE